MVVANFKISRNVGSSSDSSGGGEEDGEDGEESMLSSFILTEVRKEILCHYRRWKFQEVKCKSVIMWGKILKNLFINESNSFFLSLPLNPT